MKNERDLLDTFGNLASIGNYFKLKSIENNLNSIESKIHFHNSILTEQNNLRKIIFDIKTKIEKINSIQDTTVKSLEILYILEYLDNNKITADSFNSFEDKEYFQKVWISLKSVEKDLNIDDKGRLECTRIRKLVNDYYDLKILLRELMNLILRNDASYNKRWMYAIFITIIITVIFLGFNIPINSVSTPILLSPLIIVAIVNHDENYKLTKKCEEISITFDISKIDNDIRTRINSINERIKDYYNQIVEILSVHKEFSITIPDFTNQIYLDKGDLNLWDENFSNIKIRDRKYFIFPYLLILVLYIGLMFSKFFITPQKAEHKNQDELQLYDGQNSFLNLKQEELISLVTQNVGHKVEFIKNGKFINQQNSVIIAGISINKKFELGAQFLLFSIENELKEIYRTPILEGSFNNMHIEAIEFDHAQYELLYLNTKDYFLGSGGGEIFAYIIDFQNKEIFNAHLVIERQAGITLYISKNDSIGVMTDYFISKFSKDFPTLRVIIE